MLIFKNPGEADILALTTFGVNVKDSDSPIGFFGTGFKYAVAVLLRTGHEVEVVLGDAHFKFFAKVESIRGKDFQAIWLEELGGERTRLGFTTELGKHWEVWMAYRELWSNMRDEGGSVDMYDEDITVLLENNTTKVLVRGEAIERAHLGRSDFLLEDSKPLAIFEGVEIHPGSSPSFFYRGIKIAEVPEDRRTVFTYNFTQRIELSEDRTAKSLYMLDYYIRQAIEGAPATEVGLVKEILTAGKGLHEYELNYKDDYGRPGEGFKLAIEELSQNNLNDINNTALTFYKNRVRADFNVTKTEPTAVQRMMLEKALRICRTLGFNVAEYKIYISEALGQGTLALAIRGENVIYLSSVLMAQGTRAIASALCEEYVHLKHNYNDFTREMQTFLFNKLISLAEELAGEPV